MGRESRQARRARERRQQQESRNKQHAQGFNWSMIVGAAIVLVAAGLLGGVVWAQSQSNKSATANLPKETAGKTIDGLACNSSEQLTYHVHAHLTMLVNGRDIGLPGYVGFNVDHDCLYWTHTHDNSGIIHIESPRPVVPTLGHFFDVWHEPLSTAGFYKFTVKSGQKMEVFVNQEPYHGNPRNIPLHRHTMVTLEIGPRFVPPKPYNFHGM